MKRTDYISWDTYFMGVALLSAKRSKDPTTQVGACIVNDKKRIVGIGYNGFPYGVEDDTFPWGKDDEWLDSKYPYVVHAEPNAILNATVSLENATLYVTLFPCNECTKLIIQSGIKELVYLEDKYHDRDSFIASRRMFDSAKVVYRQLPKMDITITE
ncbi:MAG: dCMP deaminase family protein [Bacilli bacterium]|nr:dCMP deaminase family protein [Bacilli bacterium]